MRNDNLIIKKFEPHYNVALDKVITTQKQYNEEIKRGGYIPYEQAQEKVKHNLERRKEFKVSDKAMGWMRDVKGSADRKGNVKLSDRQIDFMKKSGTITDRNNKAWQEARQKDQGGKRWI